MTRAQPLDRLRAQAAERRLHNRVKVALLGRYMLSDRQEYPCQTVNISPGGALLVAAVSGQPGERIVVYLEHLGRVEGQVVRLTENGFSISIQATPRKRDKIASQLTWLANRQALGLPEDRRHERVVPLQAATTLRLENGREMPVRLIDISLSGAAVSMTSPPPLGTGVTIGRTAGKIVRHLPGGVAVEFLLPISPDRFDENLVL